MNLSSTQYTENKGLCEDLTEGKFSFPVIHSIRSNPQNLQLINILKQKTTDDVVKRYAVGYMESTGSFEYSRRRLRSLQEKALHLTDVVDEGTGRGAGVRRILDNMAVVWYRHPTGNVFTNIFEQIWPRRNESFSIGAWNEQNINRRYGNWESTTGIIALKPDITLVRYAKNLPPTKYLTDLINNSSRWENVHSFQIYFSLLRDW